MQVNQTKSIKLQTKKKKVRRKRWWRKPTNEGKLAKAERNDDSLFPLTQFTSVFSFVSRLPGGLQLPLFSEIPLFSFFSTFSTWTSVLYVPLLSTSVSNSLSVSFVNIVIHGNTVLNSFDSLIFYCLEKIFFVWLKLELNYLRRKSLSSDTNFFSFFKTFLFRGIRMSSSL